MSEHVECFFCGYEYTHIIGIIQANGHDDARGTVNEFVIDGKYTIPAEIAYKFRSQGNVHILFTCEDRHFFVKSLDGHKGFVITDDNPLMHDLASHLNMAYLGKHNLPHYIDYELLGVIEKYLKRKAA